MLPVDELHVDAPIGRTRRTLRVADGAQVQTDDSEGVDRLFAPQDRVEAGAAWLERRWSAALASLACVLVGGYLFLEHGLPRLAERLALRVPLSLEQRMGEQVLEALESTELEPSGLTEQRQAELRRAFSDLVADLPESSGLRLELRSLDTPNAFALPGGTVVMTDELVALAEDDSEIVAVLAHEVGHEVKRHTLRQILQDSTVAVLLATLTGDVSTLSSATLGVPIWLLQSAYSRQFEREADAFALDLLERKGLDPASFARVLRRLQAEAPDLKGVLSYTSTHPDSDERIAAAEARSRAPQR
jgi:predicted Zn-dependent protease